MFDQHFVEDPYAVYAQLRQTAPIIPFEAYGQQVLAVTRYDDCFHLLRDPRLTTVKVGGTKLVKQFDEKTQADMAEFVATTRRWLMFLEAPKHTIIRKLLHEYFSPAGAERLRPLILAKVQELLDQLADRDSFDLVAEVSYRLPGMIVAHLLGMPASDAPLIAGWSEPVALIEGSLRSTPEMAQAAVRAIRESGEYLRKLVAERHKNPGDDVLSLLLSAQAQDDLSDEDVVGQGQMIITGGHQTARDMIANGVFTLLRHPEQKRKLLADPSLIRSAVEEVLRCEPSIQASPRFVKEGFELYGHQLIPTDAIVFLLACANRDPAHFDDPETFDIQRKNNSHLSFGAGAHACIGASIARVEGQSCINEIFRYFPHLELADDQARWRSNFSFRGLLSLPVVTGTMAQAGA